MYFSFNKGKKQIAIVEGGKNKGKILKIAENSSKECSDSDSEEEEDDYIEDEYPTDYIDSKTLLKLLGSRNNRETKFEKLEPLRKALEYNTPKGLNKQLRNVYIKTKKDIVDKCKQEVRIDDGFLFPIPQEIKGQVNCLYIGGPSGSGKSTFTANYVKYYKKMYPDRPIWLFSSKTEDKVLDKIGVKRIVIDEGLFEEGGMDTAEFLKGKSGAMVLFDDIDTIKNINVKNEKGKDKLLDLNKEVHRIRDNLIETGRSKGVSVISTGHQLMDYKKTRNLLNEAQGIVFFPKSSGPYHIERLLKVYCGLKHDVIKKIMNLDSRWIYINKNYPMYIISEHKAFLI